MALFACKVGGSEGSVLKLPSSITYIESKTGTLTQTFTISNAVKGDIYEITTSYNGANQIWFTSLTNAETLPQMLNSQSPDMVNNKALLFQVEADGNVSVTITGTGAGGSSLAYYLGKWNA